MSSRPENSTSSLFERNAKRGVALTKRARSQEAIERESKKARADPAQVFGDHKDKKKRNRRKKRKVSVVGGDTSREELPDLNPDADDEETPGPSSPLVLGPSGPESAEVGAVMDTATERPEFVQGSSSSSGTMPSLPTSPMPTSEVKQGEHPIKQVEANNESQLSEALATSKETLRKHDSFLTAIIPSLTCQICLDLMHAPFSLSPCGHVSCHSCLVSWFTAPPAGDGPARNPLYHKKTCPQCRALVKEPPGVAWNVKDMVAALVRSGLPHDFPLPEPGPPSAEDEDPWAGIFPKPFVPVPHAARPFGEPMEQFGLLDEEDGCYRCLDCMHEIVQGECVSCERIYPGFADIGAHILDDTDDDDEHADNVGFLRNLGRELARFAAFSSDEEDAFYDAGSDDGYGGSFIDDGEGHAEVIEISSDEDEEGEARPEGARRGRRGAPIILSDEEEEDEPPQASIEVIASDEDEDEPREYSDAPEYEDDGAIPGPPRHLRHLLEEHEDDSLDVDEDEEDEGHVPHHLADRPQLFRYDALDEEDSGDNGDNGDHTPSESEGEW
ncbi:hypothetical protein FA95DRAFT_1555790 [Auriscalpium vulgare]|uniref:Uncharacterized protein n=1 Tax=Auriscalpium vulgare TaxID=40419 RepID=A0ACB8S2B0_9AGAM|nr:hypothetical protein FA95DRAFT_1555790 [Auriscalpium vulgare]